MQRVATGRRTFLAALLGAALLAGAAGPARGGETVVLGCATAADLKGLFTKIGALAEKFVPGTGAQVQGASAMLTQGPEWAGIDWSKPATIVLFSGKGFGKAEPVPVILAGIGDAAQFRQAHPEGGPMSFDIRNDVVVLAQDKAALAAITPERLELYSKVPKIAGNADLYLTAYLSLAVAEYQDEIEGGIKELEQGMAGMPAAGPMANLTSIVKCIGPLVRLAGNQVRRATMTVTFNPDSIEFWGRLYAAEDTPLGTFLSAQPTEMTDLAKYLPADLAMSMAGKLDVAKAKPFVDSVLQAIAPAVGLTAADQTTIRDLLFSSTQTGEFAAGIAGGAANPGMQTVQVLRIGDAAKFRAATKATTEWLMKTGFAGFMEAAGVKMTIDHKPAAREYQGVAIDRLTVTVAQAPDAPPNPMMGQQPPQVTELAALDTLGAGTTNNPSGELLNGILDRIKGAGTPGFSTTATCKAIAAGAPKGANLAMHVSFNSLLAKFVEEMAKQQPAIAMMAGAIIKADPGEEPITTYVSFGANMVESRTRIPHQPILALVTRVRAMIEQQQGPRMKGGPKPKDQDDF
ncbi:MAG TPA: hypothetical protein PLE19_13045 [Planctomycetota bacterium]|nr:hypothetical protein [Planctomycetota bacterium]